MHAVYSFLSYTAARSHIPSLLKVYPNYAVIKQNLNSELIYSYE